MKHEAEFTAFGKRTEISCWRLSAENKKSWQLRKQPCKQSERRKSQTEKKNGKGFGKKSIVAITSELFLTVWERKFICKDEKECLLFSSIFGNYITFSLFACC